MSRQKVYTKEDELRIGGIFPLTGYLSWAGKYKRMAAELKVQMINERGGVDGRHLRLVAYDDQSSAEQAARIAETLVFKHRVTAMVGTGSLHISRAVAGVANRYRTPAFVNSGYAIDPAKDLFVFNTAHKTEFAVACSFQYFLERGINRLALLMPRGPLGDLGGWLARRLGERMGIRIVGEERFDLGVHELGAPLRRLSDLKPYAIFSFVTGQPAVSVVESMAAQGMDIPLLVSHGNATPRFLKLISHTPVQLVVPSGKTMVLDTLATDDPCRKAVMDFNTRHVKQYSEPANYYSAELADAIDLVVEGVRRAGVSDPERLREAVENIRDFGGMQGVYDLSPIDHYGTRIEQMVLLTIKEGSWRFARAFSSLALFEDVHGNRKATIIRRLADLLSGSQPGSLLPSGEAPELTGIAAARTGLNCTDLKQDLFFFAKLHCQQKQEMKRTIREGDIVKARETLFRLLTAALLQHFESLESLRLAALELYLALFDAAMEEGIDLEELVALRHRFAGEWETAKDHETICLWITRVFDAVRESLAALRRERENDLLRRVMAFIEAHFSEDLTVDRIATEVCLSPSRLMHRMRSEHNLSLGACVARVRIEKAKSLLRNTAIAISTIAQEVGYGDQSYFTRVFRRSLGETPKTYRDRFSHTAQA
jgi:branched-chain amino acid transport system substrate-binding protein